MGLPSKLKNMNLFIDGTSHLGVVADYTMPKLALKLEDWRGGGMLGNVGIDHGVDKLEAEFTLGGLMTSAMRQFGAVTHDAVLLRFAGAYQDEATGAVRAVETIQRGRYSELDFGNAKAGDDTEHKGKLSCTYFKLTVDGVDEIEIDLVNAVFIVGGIDRYAEIRAVIGG